MKGQKKKVVIHFDINGTITAVDTTEPGNAEQNANMIVARSTMGSDDGKGCWVIDENATQSYYDWLKKTYPTEYKSKSFLFTAQENPGECLAHLTKHIVPYCSTSKIVLFESFARILTEFPDAVITLRTFGRDTDEVISALEENPRFRAIKRFVFWCMLQIF